MYHRVATLPVDPWNLAVSAANFADQLAALRTVRDVVPLDRLLTTRSERPLAAITFDDGYRDVGSVALPLLDKADCPATLFLATGFIGSGREFWWDRLARILLELPVTMPVAIAGPYGNAEFALHPTDSHEQRLARYVLLWSQLNPMAPERRDAFLDRLASALQDPSSAASRHEIMNADDVARLRGTALQIGAHTVTHPSLPTLSPGNQEREIRESRDACAAFADEIPRCFSYPFGHYDSQSERAVREAGFSMAVTSDSAFADPRGAALTIPRIAVGNWTGEALLRHIA